MAEKEEEFRTKRKQLVLYPSLHDDLELLRQILVDEQGKPIYKSFNDLINHLGNEFVAENKKRLDAYKEFLQQNQHN